MTRLPILVLVMLVVASASERADASHCAVDEYEHNGSLMEVQICDGGRLTISYVRPRQGLTSQGVRNGTLLFDGVERANGAISGQSRLFSRRCGAVTYPVAGSRRGDAIMLEGDAPVRNSACRVTRHRPDRLVFTPRSVGAGVSPPTSAGGDWYAVAGAFKARGPAEARASRLGRGWRVIDSGRCPNFRSGLWIVVAGPSARGEAQAHAAAARRHKAYAKACH